ncbi:hypothetical protein DITRI_Ditri18aG0032900 [Diplodiscus trichospermus]
MNATVFLSKFYGRVNLTNLFNAGPEHLRPRHCIYFQPFLEYEDDDSDLEYELEPCPCVSSEASAEATACVKSAQMFFLSSTDLIASGLPSDSSPANSFVVEAPLTINIPNAQSFRVSSKNSQPTCSMQGMNITAPVSVQKEILPAVTSAESLEGNRSATANATNLPVRRKRNLGQKRRIWNLLLLYRNVLLGIGPTSCEETLREIGVLHYWLRLFSKYYQH